MRQLGLDISSAISKARQLYLASEITNPYGDAEQRGWTTDVSRHG